MTNDDGANVNHTLSGMSQPSRHPAGTMVKLAIRRKVRALVAKVDAEITAEYAKLPQIDAYAERRHRSRAISNENLLKRGRPPGASHGRIGPRLPVYDS